MAGREIKECDGVQCMDDSTGLRETQKHWMSVNDDWNLTSTMLLWTHSAAITGFSYIYISPVLCQPNSWHIFNPDCFTAQLIKTSGPPMLMNSYFINNSNEHTATPQHNWLIHQRILKIQTSMKLPGQEFLCKRTNFAIYDNINRPFQDNVPAVTRIALPEQYMSGMLVLFEVNNSGQFTLHHCTEMC